MWLLWSENRQTVMKNATLIWFYYVALPNITQRFFSLVHLDRKQFHGSRLKKTPSRIQIHGLACGLRAINYWILRVGVGVRSQMESRWKGKKMTLKKSLETSRAMNSCGNQQHGIWQRVNIAPNASKLSTEASCEVIAAVLHKIGSLIMLLGCFSQTLRRYVSFTEKAFVECIATR